jgi:hypothetical protein
MDDSEEALRLFLEAGQAEIAGDVSAAIKLYTQAYHLDPMIDKHPLLRQTLSASKDQAPSSSSPESIEPVDYLTGDAKWQALISNSLSPGPGSQLVLPRSIWRRIFRALGELCPWTHEQLTLADKRLWLQSRHPARAEFIQRTRVRCDGLYVSKITYWREGETSFQYAHPVHLVTYYRFLRFFNQDNSPSDGVDGTVFKVLAYTSPQDPKLAVELLRTFPDADDREHSNIMGGTYRLIRDASTGEYVISGFLVPIKAFLQAKNSPTGQMMLYDFQAVLYSMPVHLLHRNNRLQMRAFHGYQGRAPVKRKQGGGNLHDWLQRLWMSVDDGREPIIRMDVDTWSAYKFSRVKSYHQSSATISIKEE